MHFGGRAAKHNNFFHQEVNSSVGPGTTEYMKPFGSNIKQKTFMVGKGKTSFAKKKEITPGPGSFNPDPIILKPKVPSFRINRQTKTTKYNSRASWLDYSPTKDNPNVGQYEADRSMLMTKPRTVGFNIKEPARILWTGEYN